MAAFTREQAYKSFIAELASIEAATGLYLSDVNVDIENVVDVPGGEFTHSDLKDCESGVWCALTQAAASAAGSRAEAAGKDINVLIGRVVY